MEWISTFEVYVEMNKKAMLGIRKPTYKEIKESEIEYSKVFYEAIREGLMTNAQARQLIEKRNIVDKEYLDNEKKILDELDKLEKELISKKDLGNNEEELKAISTKISDTRYQLALLREGTRIFFDNTAEKKAENSKIQFLTALLTCEHPSGTPFFNGKTTSDKINDLNNRDFNLPVTQAVVHVLYWLNGLDPKYIDLLLPENKYLKEDAEKKLEEINKNIEEAQKIVREKQEVVKPS